MDLCGVRNNKVQYFSYQMISILKNEIDLNRIVESL